MAKVTMPQLGESVAEGTIGKWLKKPGDHVAKYEPLLEVITDKVNAEVPSPFEGVLKEILVEEGATVPNNAEIAVIEEAGAAAAPAAKAAPAKTEEPAATTKVRARNSVSPPPSRATATARVTRLPGLSTSSRRTTVRGMRVTRPDARSGSQVWSGEYLAPIGQTGKQVSFRQQAGRP